MAAFSAKRIRLSYTQKYEAPPSQVFPLLCPTREYDWIETWRCHLVYSDSGYAEENCIFTTDFPEDGGDETWVVIAYEPDRTIQFVRIGAIKVIRYNITLRDHSDGSSSAEWEQIITALNEEGNRFIESLSQERYATEKKILESLLNHYLKTGERLSLKK
ncbi:MAG: hypothetical protein LAO31_10905 [Acidobacteriia bacterium]|nr:hypothetical protein [Terriglobia bacterium]